MSIKQCKSTQLTNQVKKYSQMSSISNLIIYPKEKGVEDDDNSKFRK